jgi:hypothetical protein
VDILKIVECMKGEKKWVFYVWGFLVAILWLVWFFLLDMDINPLNLDSYRLPGLVGFIAGILSGLSPKKAFQTSFLGLAIVILSVSLPNLVGATGSLEKVWVFILVAFLSFLAVFGGLIAAAGAILRRMLFNQEIVIPLESWQWNLLIGGIAMFANVFLFINVVAEFHLHQYYTWRYFAPYFVVILPGFFALGLFAGAFHDLGYQELIRSLLQLSLVVHGLFLLLLTILLTARHEFGWIVLLSLFFCLVLTVVILTGGYLGYHVVHNQEKKS